MFTKRVNQLVETIIELSEKQDLDYKLPFIELMKTSDVNYTEVINLNAIHTSKHWYRNYLKKKIQTEEELLFIEMQIFGVM